MTIDKRRDEFLAYNWDDLIGCGCCSEYGNFHDELSNIFKRATGEELYEDRHYFADMVDWYVKNPVSPENHVSRYNPIDRLWMHKDSPIKGWPTQYGPHDFRYARVWIQSVADWIAATYPKLVTGER